MAAEIPDGAVIIARAIVNSSLWTMRDQDVKLAILCIVKANWKESRWFDGRESITLKRGQFVSSRDKLAQESHLSVQKTRTALLRLEKCGFLTLKSTRHWTLLTIPKYDFYQRLTNYSDSINPESNQQLTLTQPTPNPRSTHGQPTLNHRQEGNKDNNNKKEKKGRTSIVCEGSIVGPLPPEPDDILRKPQYQDSLLLLSGIGLEKGLQEAIATTRPYDYVIELVRQSRNQRRPAGYIRRAFEARWTIDTTLTHEEREKLILEIQARRPTP